MGLVGFQEFIWTLSAGASLMACATTSSRFDRS
jgi:hypothetical protein